MKRNGQSVEEAAKIAMAKSESLMYNGENFASECLPRYTVLWPDNEDEPLLNI